MIPRLKPYYNIHEWCAALTPKKNAIDEFELSFAKKFECAFGTMFPHGRSGLYALLKCWELENVEVICPAYTCVVVQNAIVKSGNIPVFVDCEEGSFNMSIEGIRSAITPETRVVIPTHLFGYPMDVNAVDAIVKEAEEKYGHKIYVIQDVAHSFGARWNGELVTKFGDAALFGLNISKIINSIFGGMILTHDSGLQKKLQQYRSDHFKKQGLTKSINRFLYLTAVYFAFNPIIYGFVNFLERKGLLDYFVKYYEEDQITMPDDWMDQPLPIEARVGLVQLSKYDEVIRKRQELSKQYTELFGNRKDIKILPFEEGATYSHVVAQVEDRNEWVKKYQKKGIQLGILIEYSVPELKAYNSYKKQKYPVSEYYSKHLINFPNWVGLNILKI